MTFLFLSNKHQRWAMNCRYPMRYTVGAPSRTAPATEGEEVEPAGAQPRMRDAGTGAGNVECGDVTCWPEREGRANTTLPHRLPKSTTSLRGLLPGQALISHGVYWVAEGRGGSTGQGARRTAAMIYARNKGYEASYHNHDPGGRK